MKIVHDLSCHPIVTEACRERTDMLSSRVVPLKCFLTLHVRDVSSCVKIILETNGCRQQRLYSIFKVSKQTGGGVKFEAKSM